MLFGPTLASTPSAYVAQILIVWFGGTASLQESDLSCACEADAEEINDVIMYSTPHQLDKLAEFSVAVAKSRSPVVAQLPAVIRRMLAAPAL